MKTILAITIALVVALSGCKHGDIEVADKVVLANSLAKSALGEKALTTDKSYDNAPPVSPITDTSKKIIKEGDITFETSDLKITRNSILSALHKLKGYVAEEQESNNSDDHQKQYVLNLRVPSSNFDLLLDSIAGNAEKVDSKNVSIKDVTSQFIDIKTRLNNKKLLENRYLELLKKANKIGDVLQIENKLTDIRTAIDSTQGALNYLVKQVAYSSLEVTFYVKQTSPFTSENLGHKFVSAIKDGWAILQNLFFGIITIWPIVLLIVILYVPVKRWSMRRWFNTSQLKK